MAGMRMKYGDQLPRAGQPLTVADVRLIIEGVVDLRRHPQRTTFAIPPEQQITEPFVERIGRVQVTISPDGSSEPSPEEVVRLDQLAHAQRAAIDGANHARSAGHLELTDDERARGLKRPRWHSYQHLPCGRVTSLRFDDAAEGLARNPDRIRFRERGLPCACDPNGRPIDGDLQGRPGEFVWADSHGNPTPVRVGIPWSDEMRAAVAKARWHLIDEHGVPPAHLPEGNLVALHTKAQEFGLYPGWWEN